MVDQIGYEPTKTRTYILFSDPGHAWLQVLRAELDRLGLLELISGYSYQYGLYVYLEEDCDLSLFLQRKKTLGEKYHINETNENEPHDDSRVRNYESFKMTISERIRKEPVA